MSADPQTLVRKLWSYCDVLRDDGLSYGDLLAELGKSAGMLGVIFRKAQNRIQDPAKLRRLIVDLMDQEDWMVLDADVKGDLYEGLLERTQPTLSRAQVSTSRLGH